VRNRFNVFWDEQLPCQGASWPGSDEGCRKQPDEGWIIGGTPGSAGTFGLATATQSPEFGNYAGPSHARQRAQQATWSSPLTNKLLFDAGLGTNYSHHGGRRCLAIRIGPCRAWSSGRRPGSCRQLACAHGISNLTLARRTGQVPIRDRLARLASLVTGAHSMKFGAGHYHRVNQNCGATARTRLPAQSRHPESADDGPQALHHRPRTAEAFDAGTMDDGTVDAARRLRFDHAWAARTSRLVLSSCPPFTLPRRRACWRLTTSRLRRPPIACSATEASRKVNIWQWRRPPTTPRIRSATRPRSPAVSAVLTYNQAYNDERSAGACIGGVGRFENQRVDRFLANLPQTRKARVMAQL
jgi:hypothetical protein